MLVCNCFANLYVPVIAFQLTLFLVNGAVHSPPKKNPNFRLLFPYVLLFFGLVNFYFHFPVVFHWISFIFLIFPLFSIGFRWLSLFRCEPYVMDASIFSGFGIFVIETSR